MRARNLLCFQCIVKMERPKCPLCRRKIGTVRVMNTDTYRMNDLMRHVRIAKRNDLQTTLQVPVVGNELPKGEAPQRDADFRVHK